MSGSVLSSIAATLLPLAEEAVESTSEVKATPAATRKTKELGADLFMVEGTGSGGRITVQDVGSAAEQ